MFETVLKYRSPADIGLPFKSTDGLLAAEPKYIASKLSNKPRAEAAEAAAAVALLEALVACVVAVVAEFEALVACVVAVLADADAALA